MLGARPPLAHSVSGGVESELHAQYSMIAVVVLSALFFTVTVSATGLLLAFCKKNNAVFSLQHQQKAEGDSHLEMDDLDKTDDEGDDDDDTGDRRGGGGGRGSGPARPTPPPPPTSSSSSSVSRQQKQQQRRSRTFPDLFGLSLSPGPAPDPPASVDGSESSESLDARTPLMSGRGRAAGRTPVTSLRTALSGGAGHRCSSSGGGDVAAVSGGGDGGGGGRSAVTRSVTVAAIHHHRYTEGGGNSSVTVRLEDLQSGSELSDSALGHLYLKLEEEEEEEEGDHEDSDVDDDLNSDLTRALLRC